jgi:hypothetical protein
MQYQLFTYQSGGESCMELLLHEYNCNSFVAIIAKDLDTPLGTSTWHKDFLGLVSIQAQVLPNFFSVNT